jgi:uncharacterized protein YndB with AHSA1/START domain
MPEYTGSVDTTMPAEEAFNYMAEFGHTSEWDPNCTTAQKTTAGDVRVGTKFLLKFSGVAGQEMTFEYEVKEYDAPRRIVLEGGNDHLHSVDTIEVAPKGAGATVTYTAQLEGTGLAKLANPILGVGLSKAGSEAREGLEKKLNP